MEKAPGYLSGVQSGEEERQRTMTHKIIRQRAEFAVEFGPFGVRIAGEEVLQMVSQGVSVSNIIRTEDYKIVLRYYSR